MKRIAKLLIVILTVFFVHPVFSVSADIAPPETVPGSNLVPETNTQVKMIAETVTLIISESPSNNAHSIAYTQALFTMRNLGDVEEKMNIRFPLSFFNGNSDGWGNFPEIDEIEVKVNGLVVPTRREIQPYLTTEFSYPERDEIPWAVFDVIFPAQQDVNIDVAYTVGGFGYYPYEVFSYVLETGAGWYGNIGSIDIILRLPYEVNEKNFGFTDFIGYADSVPDGIAEGNEVRWHFENLEPTYENNFEFLVLTPSLWNKVLNETEIVTKNQNDGEAWGRLGKVYKEILILPKGIPRSDPAAEELFELSKEAYRKCLQILPNDSLWHYGYAELLWSRYYYEFYLNFKADKEGLLPELLFHLKTSLELDPNNQQAKDLVNFIAQTAPDIIKVDSNSYIYLALTSTVPPSVLETLEATAKPIFTSIPTMTTTTSSSQTQSTLPSSLCGGAFLFLLWLIMLLRRLN